ncbi:MAG TPA: UvrD-helicase domain-containing protein [Candidatus Hydrogenedentes bacterium]|mgnify:CR=1 FL=1|jgi:superfamily I DNA/RNA helicase|nr:UvrD-helicase domain-containing protein [Candidatus Hydrogenedentota bacterium]
MNAFLAGLNPAQREAVTHTEGPVLILAGAGSGKTRVITQRIAHILARGIAQPGEILAVTFTNKAAGEMRERVAALTGAQAARDLVISTFHSFCLRVLRAEITHLGYRKDFTISSEGDARTMVRRLLDNLDGVRETFDPDSFLEQIGWVKNSGLFEVPENQPEGDTDTARKYATWLPAVFEKYQSALRAANTLDFDDLLLLTLRLWREHPRILARYQKRLRYVMVDEYQDTNPLQYELLRLLASAHRNLCVVGDDDQSIYGWRGADIQNILSFEKDYPDARIVTLEQNYRSTQTILSAANAVIANNRARREKRLWSELGAGRPLDWFVTADEEHEAKMIVSWIQHIRDRTRAKYTDFAVLYRSNLQSRPIEIAMRQAKIPYVVVGGQDFFERTEVKDIIAYLRAVVNPRDEAAFLRIANMPRRGIGDATLHQVHALCLAENLPFAKGLSEAMRRGLIQGRAEAGIRELSGLLRGFGERFRQEGVSLTQQVQELVDRIGYRAELVRTSKSDLQLEQKWSNVEAVIDAVAQYEQQSPVPPTLNGFLDESALNKTEDHREDGRQQRSGVTLMTIHSAKGLEFPFVLIAGIEEGLLPHEKCLQGAALEEERRLFYVALTRAKRHATLFESCVRSRRGRERLSTTSRFIKEIPETLLCRHVRAAREMIAERTAPAQASQSPKRRRRSK